jgi:hypothetical protein
MRPALVVLCVLAALACGAGCEPTYPGTELGTYRVIETLTENTCGAGLPALSTVELDVELRADGAVGYWRLPRKGVVAGSYAERDGAFEFRVSQSVVAWPADVATGVLGCTVEQREVIRGTAVPTVVTDAAASDSGPGNAGDAAVDAPADAGADDDRVLLVGEHTVDVVATRGSDCAALLASSGGSFDAVPCRVRYTLSGVASSTAF